MKLQIWQSETRISNASNTKGTTNIILVYFSHVALDSSNIFLKSSPVRNTLFESWLIQKASNNMLVASLKKIKYFHCFSFFILYLQVLLHHQRPTIFYKFHFLENFTIVHQFIFFVFENYFLHVHYWEACHILEMMILDHFAKVHVLFL
jgi:hypothetical protein